ncbi:MAG: TIGR03960 family B12-binding radical SAM protein, partial [Myxococcota bacterium]
MDVREHPYAPFLHEVKTPAQYIGGEHGEKKKDWSDVSCRMCLAFPDLYEIGMSHLGYKILYGIVNGHEKLLAERAYAPWIDMEAKLREHGEVLRSLESARPLRDFDIVGFSLQFELTYTNVLTMLDLGGIPLRSDARGDDDPLVVCGGPVATHGEPMAPFIDVFLIGDGEEKTPQLMLAWAQLRDAGVPRHERLEAIAKLGGFYVPSLYVLEVEERTGHQVIAGPVEGSDAPYPVERAIVRDLKPFEFPADGPVAATETIFDRVSIEVARGCTEGCRFCQAGMIYRPVRERDPQAIVDTIVKAVKEGGYDEASLTSLSTADYSAIEPLVHEVMKALKGKRVNVSVSSLRAYGLSEAVLDDMKTQRAGGLTFAPEAGTQRMRDVVNKNVTEAQLMETAERVFSRGWTKMKLYFMIGLPTEEDEDVAGIAQTGGRAREVARRVRGRNDAKVTVSVSSHVPKPHTPFQWCAMDTHDEIVRKQKILRKEAKIARVQLRVHDSTGSWLEGVLARGDRRLANVIESAWANGARFDSWGERLKLDAWEAAFEAHGVSTAPFLGTIPTDARLPWDHIDVGLEEGFLAKEYRKALRNRLSPPCGKVAGTFVHHTNLADAQADTRR